MHLESILPVFASVSVMISALQMTAIFFATQTQDPNKQLIDRLTANLPQQLFYQRQQNYDPPVCYHYELTEHFFRDCNNPFLLFLAPRNNNNQNNRTINNNVLNQRPNYANINFFEEDFLVEATKKKAKINFVLDSNKAFTLTVNNNEPPKAKVFKNSSKLESPKIVQKSGFYSVVKDFMETLKKSLQIINSKEKTPKINKHSHQARLADNSNVTSLICKAQVAGYFINLILNSRLSVNVIAKHFLEAIERKINEFFTWPITNIYGDKKKTILPAPKQNQEEKQSNESDNNKNNEEED
ncbi:hypothetical protein G9A89_009255 [Geosiphon pyriformis]|nr:hypothetical protein G9A89_009255 [Geosiphon pyriformis]